MRAPRGKVTALWIALASVAALAGAGWSLKDRLREEWWMHKLHAEDGETALVAASRLFEMDSTRAVPEIIKRFEAIAPGDYRES